MVFKSLDARDSCSRLGRTYRNKTLSFASDELLTSRAVHDSYGFLHYPFKYSWTAFNYAEITNSYVAVFFFFFSFFFLFSKRVEVGHFYAFIMVFQLLTSCPLPPPSRTCTEVINHSIEEDPYTNTNGVTITPEANTWYYNPCFPFLSLPTQVLSLEPAWSTCVHGFGAFYDPPRVLTSVSDLLAPVQASTTTMASSHEDSVHTGGATAGQAITIPPIATPTIAPPLVLSPTTPPTDPIQSPDLRPENKPLNSQPGPIPNVAQGPQVTHSIPKNSLTKSFPQPLPTVVDPKSPPHPSEGTSSTKKNQSNDDGTQAPRPVAPLIYISGEKVVEGAAPTTIGGKVVVYSSGTVNVGDKFQLVPTAIPQAHPGTTFDVEGLLLQVKAPSPPEKPYEDGTKASGPVAPLIYVSGVRVVEGATPTTIGGKVVVYSSGSLHVGDQIQPIPTAIPQSYRGTSINFKGLHVEIKAPSSPPSTPPKKTNTQTPIITSGPIPNIVAQQNYHIVLNGQTIIAGGPAQTISGTRISLASSGTAIIEGKHTSPVPNRSNLPPNAAPTITLSIGSSTYTLPLSTNFIISAASNSQLVALAAAPSPTPFIVLQGQTLLAGGDAKLISGTLVSLLPSATALLVAGKTVIPISKSAPDAPAVVVFALTLGSSKYTATLSSTVPFIASNSGIVAQTLFPGSVVTVGGRLISLDDDASHSGGGRSREGLGAVILGEFHGDNNPDPAHEGTSSSFARVILFGSQKQTITPTPVLVGGRTVYIYPSAADLVMSGVGGGGGGGGSTIITTNTSTGSGGSPFPPRTTVTGGGNTSSNTSSVGSFFTGSTSSLRLSTCCGGWVCWERITRMILAISLSVIIAY